MDDKQKKILLLSLILLTVVISHFSGISNYLSFENLKENRDVLKNYVVTNYVVSVILYILIYIIVIALSLPGAAILTLAGGFMFGALYGVIFVNIAATIGATIIFIVARNFLGDFLQEKYGDKLNTFNKEFETHGKSYFLTLRLIPFPFWMVNLFAGLTKVSLSTYVWTTSLGIIPGSFAYAFAGQQLGTIDGLNDIVSTNMLAVFVVLGLLSLIPVFIDKIQHRKMTVSEVANNVRMPLPVDEELNEENDKQGEKNGL